MGLENLHCEEKLRDDDWLSLQKRQLSEHLTATLQHLLEVMTEAVPGFSQHDERTRAKGGKSGIRGG